MQRIFIFSILICLLGQADSFDVYFGTGGRTSKGIYQARLDSKTGKLTQPKLAAEIGSPGFLAMHPNQSVIYAVANRGEPCVAAFQIKDDASLKLLNIEPIGDGGGAHLSVHPSGKFLLTAQYGGASTALFPLKKNGRIGERTELHEHSGASGVVANRQNAPHPHWTGFSPDGRFAFVPDLGTDQIVIYKVDLEKVSIEPHGFAHSLPGAGPRHMRFSADGKFIFLLNELNLSITSFAYNSEKGTAERQTTIPTLSQSIKEKEAFNSASEILIHANGRFVYSANRGHDSISVFRVNQKNGELFAIEVEPIRGSWPRNINLDPSGQWLLAAGAHSNTISVFRIDSQSGELSFQTRGIINIPSPICILFK